GPHPDIVSQRIATLYRLPSVRRGVLVVPVATLMQRLPPRSHIAGSGLSIARGQSFDLADEQRRLEACGYRHVPQVNEPGDFAVRGALIDIFPMGSREPYRVELFDREIDSIRSFDPETQRSLQQVDKVELLPAREFPLTEDATKAFRERLRERFPIDVRRCPLYQDMKAGVSPAGIEYYLPLFFERTETLFDYLDEHALFLVGEGALEAAEHFWSQVGERHEQRAHDVERPILPPVELYLPPQGLREQLNQVLRVDLDASDPRAADTGTRPATDLRSDSRQGSFAQRLHDYLDGNPQRRVLLAADSAGRREALLEQLAASGLRPAIAAGWQALTQADAPRFAIVVASLERGFELAQPAITVFSERELLGERARSERRRRAVADRDPEAIVRDLSELAVGAPIVHVDHGVGRYLGLVTLDVGGMPGEFLAIEYARATSCTCRSRNCRWSAATPARRRNWRRCIRWAATRGSARKEKPRKKCATRRRNYWRSTHSARRAPGWRRASTARCWRNSRTVFRSRKRRTRWPRSMRCWPTSKRPSRWIAWSAATWASARPKSRCARPSPPPPRAGRSRCWCRPPCWRSSTTTTSATGWRISRCAWNCCRASARRRKARKRCRSWPTARSTW